MIFLKIFILAHLTGDFLLQTNNISKRKAESVSGVFLHTVIVFSVKILFMSLFGLNGIIAAAISSLLHFILDFGKFKMGNKLFRSQFIYFLVDQFAHILIILFLYKAFKTDPLAAIPVLVDSVIVVLIVTYVISVAVKIFLRDIFVNLKSSDFFLKYERIVDAFFGLAIYYVPVLTEDIFIKMVSFILLITAYIYLQKKMFFYKEKHFLVKLIFIILAILILKSAIHQDLVL